MKMRACFSCVLLGIAFLTVRAADSGFNPVERFLELNRARGAVERGGWEKRASFGPGRIFHSAVWTYSEMIVWGGGSEHQFYNSGGVYDPVTDRWRVMSQDGAPSGRWGHAAVWTGTEMIVWGGRSSFSPSAHHRDGAIYDPRADRWRPMSMEGAPEGRSQMAAVWTGEEMIVWGGWSDGGKCYSTGAAYNPRSDQWRALPIDGAPEPRIEPAAVWTGREMIVWGGLREGERHSTATGARYNPETQKWTSLPMNGAPAPARGTQAAWTGTEMIVWGGANLEESWPKNRGLKTGGRYSPEKNEWRRIQAPEAVDGRLYHVAAWTGTEMIVWGGGDQEVGHLASGARYEAETDRWRVISAEGAPAPRSFSTAVWTGEGVLIYGGSTGGTGAFDETYFLRINPD
jgi:N-acetylneuraminic acid mutarotase